jgi:hypothetical protein
MAGTRKSPIGESEIQQTGGHTGPAAAAGQRKKEKSQAEIGATMNRERSTTIHASEGSQGRTRPSVFRITETPLSEESTRTRDTRHEDVEDEEVSILTAEQIGEEELGLTQMEKENENQGQLAAALQRRIAELEEEKEDLWSLEEINRDYYHKQWVERNYVPISTHQRTRHQSGELQSEVDELQLENQSLRKTIEEQKADFRIQRAKWLENLAEARKQLQTQRVDRDDTYQPQSAQQEVQQEAEGIHPSPRRISANEADTILKCLISNDMKINKLKGPDNFARWDEDIHTLLDSVMAQFLIKEDYEWETGAKGYGRAIDAKVVMILRESITEPIYMKLQIYPRNQRDPKALYQVIESIGNPRTLTDNISEGQYLNNMVRRDYPGAKYII